MPSELVANFLGSELGRLEEAFKEKIIKILEGMSDIEAVQFIKEFDFFSELQNAGLTNIINQIDLEYSGIIDAALNKAEQVGKGISGINLSDLDFLLENDAKFLLGRAESFATQFQSGFIRGMIGGSETGLIVTELKESGISLTTNELIASVNTARDQFNSVSLLSVFEDDPDTRFRLVHVIDIRTRCSCKEVFLRQPKNGFTRAEIQTENAWHNLAMSCPDYARRYSQGKQMKYNIINRGGYNCRGFVEVL